MTMKNISDKQVVLAYDTCKKLDCFPYELLMKWTGQPEKVCYRAMERAEGKGLIEYGVSLRSGWLTEKGEKLLKSADND